MGEKIDNFHQQMSEAMLPTLRWTANDKQSLWNIPLSQWGDYFALKKAKSKMMKLHANRQVTQKMHQFIPMYISAVQKGRTATMDYLQAYGDLILENSVQNHFEQKYGTGSKQWAEFTKKESALWNKVIELRQSRQESFLKQSIMELEQLPERIRKQIIKNNNKKLLRRCLESYYHYQDGEDRNGKKMPLGLKPPQPSLVALEERIKNKTTEKPENKIKKPLPPIRITRTER